MILEATNFQAWPRFELVVEGLTVIVGDSNLGKSAIFRALRGVLRNDIGAGRVKIGEDVCTVTCTYEGVNAKITRPRKGSVTYVVNGVDYSRLAKEVPKEIKALNFEPVEIGTAKLDPIFAGQFGSQFLLESSPAELGQVLGAFASTEKLEKGRKILRQRVTDIDKEAKLLADIIGRAQDEAAAVEIKVDKVRKIEDEAERLNAVISTKMPVCELLTQILTATSNLRRLRPFTTIEIPQFDHARGLQRAGAAAVTAATSTHRAQRAKRFLENLTVLTAARERVSQSVQTIQYIDEILGCREIDTSSMMEVFDAHRGPQKQAKTLFNVEKKLRALIEAYSGYKTVKREIEAIDAELGEINTEREQVQAQVQADREAATAARIQKELEAKKVQCPECGTKFVPERA
jgi:ABC-type transporter Mla MlaB component